MSVAALLEVEDAEVRHGDLQAVSGVGLHLAEGEVLAVIGANGAGKSTLLAAVAGLLPLRTGRVRLDGADLAGVPAHRRVGRGITLVPEGRRLFPSLSVQENLVVGAHARRPGPWSLAAVYELLPLLADHRTQRAGSLSGGQQQAVAIGRGLMANPRLLLLDEVSLGLAPVVVAQLYAALPAIVASGASVLVVEQDVRQAMAVADRVHCLLEGRTVLEGLVATVRPEEVSRAYFGT